MPSKAAGPAKAAASTRRTAASPVAFVVEVADVHAHLYRVTLRVRWPVEQIPYGRKPRPLPVVLSQDEVVRLVEAVSQVACRMALLTAYAAGLRISEVVALRAEHRSLSR